MPSNFRVTTNGLFRAYGNNLHASQKRLSDHMTEVETGRAFQSYKEDPVAASKAFQLRRSYWNTGNQIESGKYVTEKFQTAWDAIGQIVDGNADNPGLSSIDTALRALNDPEAGARQVLGREMMTTADSITLLMNSRYVNEFVFAGADGLNTPAALENGNVYYRDINVNATDVKAPAEFGINAVESDGSVMKLDKQLERVAELVAATAKETELYGETVKVNDIPLTEEEYFKKYAGAADEDDAAQNYEAYKEAYSSNHGIDFDDRMAARKYVDYVRQIRENYGDDSKDEHGGDVKMSSLNAVGDEAELPASTDLDNLADTLAADLKAIVDKSQADYDKLQAMTEETTYIDIGMGFVHQDVMYGEPRRLEMYDVTPASAFNSALTGISMLGYGTDEDGDPKNITALIYRLGEIFNNCDPDTGDYASREAEADANRLTGKLHAAIDRVSEQHVELDARVGYLKKNQNELEDKKFDVNEQILETEEAEPAESIMEMMWAQYSYNAALRIGNNILSQSLIDYMG